MFDSFLSHVLVLLLLLISAIRIFFIKNPRIDSVTLTSPIAFLVSLLIFFVWGFQIQTVLVSALALLFFLTNLRALFRLSEELVVDDYSTPFKIATIFELFLVLVAIAFVFWTRPVRYTPKDYGVTKTAFALSGNFLSGFKKIKTISELFHGERETGTLSVYEPSEKIVWENDGSLFNALSGDKTFVDVIEEFEKDEPKSESLSESEIESWNLPFESNEIFEEVENEFAHLPVLLFVGTAHGTADCYEPYFLFLAQKGFTVIAADFFPPDSSIFSDWKDWRTFRRIFTLLKIAPKNANEEEKNRILALEKEQKKRGYIALTSLLQKENADAAFFYLTEGLDFEEIKEISKSAKDSAVGFFSLNRIDEYKTLGYGFIEQTDVLLAQFLGFERDKEFFIPRYAAFKTIQSIEPQYSAFKAAKNQKNKNREAE